MAPMIWQPHQQGGVDYEWSLTSDHVYLREVGAGKKWTKLWALRRSGEA